MIRNAIALTLLIAFMAMLLPVIALAQNDPQRRVYVTADGATWSRSGMLPYAEFIARIADADVVFLGEQHGDMHSHEMQLEILTALSDAHIGGVVLSMEQFERDVQGVLDSYLAGEIDEELFLADSRPWPNYDCDYRPLVEYSRGLAMPVIAANIPRPLASRIAKEGFDVAWAGYTPEERELVAGETSHPKDAYWELFKLAMGVGNSSEHGMGFTEEKAFSYYTSQCIKDDTMAESIALALKENPGAMVVHTNGTFHSDYRLGTVMRIESRNPKLRIVTVAIRPVESWSNAGKTSEQLPSEIMELFYPDDFAAAALADFIIFVPGPDIHADEAVPITLEEDAKPEIVMGQ